MSYWINFVKEELEKKNKINIDPRHVLAYVMLPGQSLSGMSKRDWNREINIGIACVKEGGVNAAENCAKSFGL
jgi:hypothetical protein